MSDTNTKVVDELNGLAEKRFSVEVRREVANSKYKASVAALDEVQTKIMADLDTEAKQLDLQISQLIQPNRNTLIERGKQSFVIMRAKFQFRRPTGKTKVTDPAGIMEVARKLGVVRKVAKPSYSWKLNQAKFFAWLDAHGELRKHFEEYLDDSSSESLTMQPNGNYTVHHDSRRISPPSVSIGL